jgi:hypothetical protein
LPKTKPKVYEDTIPIKGLGSFICYPVGRPATPEEIEEFNRRDEKERIEPTEAVPCDK